MQVLIVGLNYLPESTSIGPYTADLAEYLRRRGHDVKVVTGFPMAPQWQIWPPYRGKRFMRETINGVEVLRTYLYVPERPGRALHRVLFDMSFSLSALLGGLTTGRRDLILVVSPPLQLGITGWLLGLVKGARLFFHIQDLVPDAAIAAGLLREESLAVRVARALETFVYSRAARIGVICDGFARHLVERGVPSHRVVVLPDYIDLEFMRPGDRLNAFRGVHGLLADDFLVMYSGSVALKQGLETFIDAAAEFHEQDRVVFFLIGEGPYLEGLKARAEALRLTHLRFLPLQPRNTLPWQLSAADVLVITQRKAITDVVFPGKLLYYMASGRPILAAVNSASETGRFVNEHHVGLVVPPEDPAALAQAIRYMREHRDQAAQWGLNGRKVAEAKFDQRTVLEQFAVQLEALAARSP